MAETKDNEAVTVCPQHGGLATSIASHGEQLKALWDRGEENQKATLIEIATLREAMGAIRTEIVRSSLDARNALLEERLVAQKMADENKHAAILAAAEDRRMAQKVADDNRHAAEIAVLEERRKSEASVSIERTKRMMLNVKVMGLATVVSTSVGLALRHFMK